MNEYGLTQEEAARSGREVPSRRASSAALGLCPEVQELRSGKGELSGRSRPGVLQLKSEKKQQEAAQKIVRWAVRPSGGTAVQEHE